MRTSWLGGLLVVLVACGSPAAPTPPAPPTATVAVVDGITGASLDTRTGTAGAAVTVDRAGYLRRDTLLPAHGPVTLWPVTVDESYVRALVYAEVGSLMRWGGTQVSIAADFPAQGMAEVNGLGLVSLVPVASGAAITWAIDPADTHFTDPRVGAVAYRTLAGPALASARIVFRDEVATLRRLPAHELGHAIGLGHSARESDLMVAFGATASFSSDERVLLAMMYAHRRAGQVAPDNDQGLGAASLTTRTIVVVD